MSHGCHCTRFMNLYESKYNNSVLLVTETDVLGTVFHYIKVLAAGVLQVSLFFSPLKWGGSAKCPSVDACLR
jgi:hypothetical protein